VVAHTIKLDQMNLKVFRDYQEVSRATADLIADFVRRKGDAMICVASGHTPVGVFKCMIEDVNSGKVDLSKVTFVSLDEWIGIDPEDPGSCLAMLKNDLFNHLTLRKDQIQFFDVTAPDLQKECDRINKLISDHGGLDVMLVGIGTNGHIGMNEPGSSFDDYAHISLLAEETITTGQKYFRKVTKLEKGITLGLRHFREAKVPILMANGTRKAEVMKHVMSQTSATRQIPASLIHEVKGSYVMIDKDAAEKITKT
jgi:glucosamine-6-phosphate isomerase